MNFKAESLLLSQEKYNEMPDYSNFSKHLIIVLKSAQVVNY